MPCDRIAAWDVSRIGRVGTRVGLLGLVFVERIRVLRENGAQIGSFARDHRY